MIAEDEYALARKRMVEEQIAARDIRASRVLAALGSVLRHCFIPPDDLAWAYARRPAADRLRPDDFAAIHRCLDDRIAGIGIRPTACWKSAAGAVTRQPCWGNLAAEVHTVEVIPELAQQAEKTLADLGYTHIHVHSGDGSPGWPEAAPYNKILVAAAAPDVPQPLLDQLNEGGQLVIPVGSRSVQQLEVWKRTGQEFNRQVNLEVCFVPLRGKYGWL